VTGAVLCLSGPLLEDPRGSLRAVGLSRLPGYLVDYPFADRLYPCALEVLKRLQSWGRTVILSDGDVVFQPRKVERSGISEAVSGHVLIYIHKEAALSDVEQRYPAAHCVMVDDKVRILAAMKKEWAVISARDDALEKGAFQKLQF
jgi:hypothetical protein